MIMIQNNKRIEKQLMNRLIAFFKRNDIYVERKNMGMVYFKMGEKYQAINLGKGLPDLQIIIGGKAYYIECKSHGNSAFTINQKEKFFPLSLKTGCEIMIIHSENEKEFIDDFKEFLSTPRLATTPIPFDNKYTFANYKEFD